MLTTGGSGFTWGDALCIASAVLFGVHKFRTETITERFRSDTQQLVALQLAVLALVSAVVCLPEIADAVQGRSPGGEHPIECDLPSSCKAAGASLAYLSVSLQSINELDICDICFLPDKDACGAFFMYNLWMCSLHVEARHPAHPSVRFCPEPLPTIVIGCAAHL